MKNYILSILSIYLLTACQTIEPPKTELAAADEGTLSYPISRPYNGKKINGVGALEFPEKQKEQHPLIILVHGTAGVGQRERAWADFFQSKGAATFVLDYFRPRGANSKSRFVPRPPEDVHAALKLLSTHPKIDTDNVAIMGFSNGGSVAAMSAHFVPETDTNGVIPKAYIMMYGGCSIAAQGSMFFANGTSPAVLFIAGEKDALVSASTCQDAGKSYKIKNGKTLIIPGAYHGFDSFKNVSFVHPRWGNVTMRHSNDALEISRKEVMDLLKRTFSQGSF